MMGIVSRMGIPELSKWFNEIWVTQPTFHSIINHIIFLGEFNSNVYNPVIWSLIHELRISILFPLIMLLVLRYGWKRNIIMTISIPVLFCITYIFILKVFKYDITINTMDLTSYLLTPHYVAFFMLGAIMAKYKQFLNGFYATLNLGMKYLIW